jgi:hypothetical protein
MAKVQLELKHVRGIPYYLQNTTVYTFELVDGRPSDTCVAIGSYDEKTDTIEYVPDWEERIQERLGVFRQSIVSQDRKTLRESITKPQKPKKAARAPRKAAVVKAKSAKST